jgi:hypothetical protein
MIEITTDIQGRIAGLSSRNVTHIDMHLYTVFPLSPQEEYKRMLAPKTSQTVIKPPHDKGCGMSINGVAGLWLGYLYRTSPVHYRLGCFPLKKQRPAPYFHDLCYCGSLVSMMFEGGFRWAYSSSRKKSGTRVKTQRLGETRHQPNTP